MIIASHGPLPHRRVKRLRRSWVTETVGGIWATIRHDNPIAPQIFEQEVADERQDEAVKNALDNSTL